ncbi:MAG: hypothetical protein ABIH37_05810 [archaeon]
MLRICLIGPGSFNFHFQDILGISKEKFDGEIDKIANVLSNSGFEVVLSPSEGVSFEVAKKVKEKNGKIIGVAPLSDKYPGVGHLQSFIDFEVKGKKLFSEMIDSGDWPAHNLRLALFGDCLLFLGKSPGSSGELNFGFYMYKIIKGMKPSINQSIEKIHKKARAGVNIDYHVFVYTKFLKDGKLGEEEEAYAKKFGIKIVYVKNAEELEKGLRELEQNL